MDPQKTAADPNPYNRVRVHGTDIRIHPNSFLSDSTKQASVRKLVSDLDQQTGLGSRKPTSDLDNKI